MLNVDVEVADACREVQPHIDLVVTRAARERTGDRHDTARPSLAITQRGHGMRNAGNGGSPSPGLQMHSFRVAIAEIDPAPVQCPHSGASMSAGHSIGDGGGNQPGGGVAPPART